MDDDEYEIKKCVYCGEDADTKDHFIPVSYYWTGKRRGWCLTSDYGKDNLLDCCRECNMLASDKIFTYFNEKREFIQERLVQRYKKTINMPFWSDEEINEMGYGLKKEIRIQQLARKWILNRINYPFPIYPYQKLTKELKYFIENQF